MQIPILDTSGEKFSWAQFVFKEAVLYRALRQDPRAGLEIFKAAAKNARYLKNVFFHISGARTRNRDPRVSKN
jgi:hypothetical protein